MKNFTKLMLSLAFLCFSIGVFAQPTAAPAAPTAPALNVISIYGSDTYTPISGVKAFEDWGQVGQAGSTIGDYSIPGTDPVHKVLKYGKLSFQGIDFVGNAQDVSGMKWLHMDIWTESAASTPLSVALINAPAPNVALFVTIETAGSWYSLDIPLSEYVGVDKTKIDQIMLKSSEWATTATNVLDATIYLDNIYFWTDVTPSVVLSASTLSLESAAGSTGTFDITASGTWTVTSDASWLTISDASGTGDKTITLTASANTSVVSRKDTVKVTGSDNEVKNLIVTQKGITVPDPVTPTAAATDVKSIYSDSYDDLVVSFENWYGTAITGDSSQTAANKIKKVSSACCFGYAFTAPEDLSLMEKMHIDIYPTTITSLTMGIVAGGEFKKSITLSPDSWNSIDILLSEFAGATLNAVAQIGFWDLAGEFYMDNLYFYKSGGSTGISKYENSNIRIYPNPVESNLFIDGLSESATIKIFDMGGKLLIEKQRVGAGINVEKLENGIYMVQISDDNSLTMKKFVKK